MSTISRTTRTDGTLAAMSVSTADDLLVATATPSIRHPNMWTVRLYISPDDYTIATVSDVIAARSMMLRHASVFA